MGRQSIYINSLIKVYISYTQDINLKLSVLKGKYMYVYFENFIFGFKVEKKVLKAKNQITYHI